MSTFSNRHAMTGQILRRRSLKTRVAKVVILGVPIFAFLGLGVKASLGRPLWRDEFATMAFSDMSPSELWTATGHVDFVLSPYYLLMHLVPGSTTSEFALRSVSLAAATFTLLLVGLIALRWWGSLGAGTAVFVLAFNPLFIELAATARPYALAIFFITASIIFLDQALRDGRCVVAWSGFSLCLIFAGLTHLFALLAVASTIVLVLPRGQKKTIAWLVSTVSAGLVLLPFAARAFMQQGQVSWIPSPDLRSTFGSLASLIIFERDGELGKVQGLGLLLVFVCFVLAMLVPGRKNLLRIVRPCFHAHMVFVSALFTLPWAFLTLESFFFTPFLRTTYLAPSLIGLSLGLGGLMHLLLQIWKTTRDFQLSTGHPLPEGKVAVASIGALFLIGSLVIPLPTSAAWLVKSWWIDDFPGLATTVSADLSPGDTVAFVQLGSESGVRVGLAKSLHDEQFELDAQKQLVEGNQPTIELRRVVSLEPFATVESSAPVTGSSVGLVFTRSGFTTNAVEELSMLGIQCPPEEELSSVNSFGLLRYVQNAC